MIEQIQCWYQIALYELTGELSHQFRGCGSNFKTVVPEISSSLNIYSPNNLHFVNPVHDTKLTTQSIS